jgi:hypothetical protein
LAKGAEFVELIGIAGGSVGLLEDGCELDAAEAVEVEVFFQAQGVGSGGWGRGLSGDGGDGLEEPVGWG